MEIRRALEQKKVTHSRVERLKQLWKERLSIYKELDHYRDTNQVFGQHQVFEKRRFREELTKLNGPELVKKYNAVAKSLRGIKRSLEKDPRKDLLANRKSLQGTREWQLEELEKHLDRLK